MMTSNYLESGTDDSSVEEDLRKMRISGWRGKALRRDEWKSVLREVKVL
jgi:hypothetical protein